MLASLRFGVWGYGFGVRDFFNEQELCAWTNEDYLDLRNLDTFLPRKSRSQLCRQSAKALRRKRAGLRCQTPESSDPTTASGQIDPLHSLFHHVCKPCNRAAVALTKGLRMSLRLQYKPTCPPSSTRILVLPFYRC